MQLGKLRGELLIACRHLLSTRVGVLCATGETVSALGKLAQTALQLGKLRGELLVPRCDLLGTCVRIFGAAGEAVGALRELA